jgi:lipopolysaccharide transport system ATP-binding protein
MSTLVSFDRVWKKFPRTHGAKRKYASELFRRNLFGSKWPTELRAHEHWGLHDVTLQIARGEALGVIGSNGAGKSTLLSLIAGLHQPDRGHMQVHGHVSSFINLSAGLKTNMSGIDNIFFKSALEGRTREEVNRKLDDIIEFSGLGDRIEDPISTYSSGMKLRLGFSVAVHSEPDVLLVDEVLAVGDFEFKQKCLRRVQELKDQCAFLLVSHSMPQIARFCDRALFLADGQVKYLGDVNEAIRLYQGGGQETQKKNPSSKHLVEQEYFSDDDVDEAEFGLQTDSDQGNGSLAANGSLTVRGRLKLKRPIEDFRIGIPIRTPVGEIVTAVSSEQTSWNGLSVPADTELEFEVTFPSLPLNAGEYVVIAAIHDGPRFLVRRIIGTVVVHDAPALTWGSFTPQADWDISLN